MEINLLKPVRAVHQSFYKPNLPMAFALVLLASVFSIVGAIILGLQFNIAVIALSAVSSVASWIAIGILFYVIGFVAEGNSLKGKLPGILSALSLVWLVCAIMAIAGLILVAMWPSDVITTINELQRGQLGADQAFAKMSMTLDTTAEQTNSLILIAFNVVAFALMAFALLIIFLISKEISPKSTAKQLAITLALIISWVIISGIASTVFVISA